MANVQVDATADIAIGARVVIRDSNDFVYVLVNAGGNIRAYKGNIAGEPTSFAEQDAVGAPNSADIAGIAAAIDSVGLIHVMYYFDDTVAHGGAPNIRYAQFRSSAHATTQDDWVLINEQIANMTNSEDDFSFTHLLGIAIDANDDPHASWNDEINSMGSGVETIFYDNRIGGTWGGRIEVQRAPTSGAQMIKLDLMIADPASSVNADRPIIILQDDSSTAMDAFHGTALNAIAFTKTSDITGTIDVSVVIQRGIASIGIDSNEKITVTFIENTSNDLMIVEHLNSSAWGTWETPVDVDTAQDYGNPSIAIDGTNRYIFVEHVNDNDIHLWKDVGAGFVEETADADLPNLGTFNDVKCKWASKNNNSPLELDYVFEDSGGAVQYNTFQGAAGALGPFSIDETIGITEASNSHLKLSISEVLGITEASNNHLKLVKDEVIQITESVNNHLKLSIAEVIGLVESTTHFLKLNILETVGITESVKHSLEKIIKVVDEIVGITESTVNHLKLVINEKLHVQDTKYTTFSSLEAHLKLDDVVTDSSGNGNNGTVTGSELYVNAPIQRGFDFDGSSYITLANEANFDFERTDKFSESFWIKTTDGASFRGLIHKANSSLRGFNVYHTGVNLFFQLANSDISNDILVRGSGVAINNGEWHHVVWTYNGNGFASGIKIYYDGISRTVVVSRDLLTDTILHDDPLRIGIRGSLGFEFTGQLDDVQIYSKELTADEVRQIFEGGNIRKLSLFRTITDTLGITESTTNFLKLVKSEVVRITEAVNHHLKLVKNEIVQIIESVNHSLEGIIIKVVDEIVGIIESTTHFLKLNITETVGITEATTNFLKLVKNEVVQITEQVNHSLEVGIIKVVDEIVGITESTTHHLKLSISEIVQLAESTTNHLKLNISEILGITESVNRFLHRIVNETVGITEARNRFLHRIVNETVGLTESTTHFLKLVKNETIGITESVNHTLEKIIKVVNEIVGVTESIVSSIVAAVPAVKTPEFGGIRTAKKRIAALMSDGFNKVRILVRMRGLKREHAIRILNTIYYPWGLGTPVTVVKSLEKSFESKVTIIKQLLEKSSSTKLEISIRSMQKEGGKNKANVLLGIFSFGAKRISIKRKAFDKGISNIKILRHIEKQGSNVVKVKSLAEIIDEIEEDEG